MKEVDADAKRKIEAEMNERLKTDGVRFEYKFDEDYDCDEEGDDTRGAILNVTACIPFGDFDKATKRWYKNHNWQIDAELEKISKYRIATHIKAIVPPLVPANLGDFVLIYSTYEVHEDDLHVGLVTSVIKNENGKTCYGCRHFVMKDDLLRRFDFDLHNPLVKMTSEDYGGHPVGFYKVISEKEAVARVVKMATKEFEKRVQEIRENLDDLCEDLVKGVNLYKHRTSCETLAADEIRATDYEE